ncbi:MAG: TolC family protein [Sphingobacterium sp.]
MIFLRKYKIALSKRFWTIIFRNLDVRIILLLGFIILNPQVTVSQNRLRLNDALAILDSLNIDIQQSKLDIMLAEQEAKDAKNARFPKLNVGASHNYNFGLAFDQIAGQLITGNRWTNSANANVGTQAVLFQGFELRNQIRNALLNLETQHVEIKSLKRSLKLQLLQIYFTAITNQALYQSSIDQLHFSEEQLRLQKEQFDMGTKTLVDVSLAESQVATDELNALTSNNNYLNSLIELKQLLNLPYSDSIELEVPTGDIDRFPFLDTLNMNSAMAENPFVAIADLNLTKAELARKTAKNSSLPTLTFSGGYGTNYSSERNDFLTGTYMPFWNQVNQNRSLYFGLSLAVPLFDGFRIRSAKNKANLQVLIQTNERDKVRMEQEKIYRQATQELHRSIEEYKVAQKQFNSLKTALNAMSERYKLGVASSVDFAKALLDHNLAEFNVITTKYNSLYNNKVLKVLFNNQ